MHEIKACIGLGNPGSKFTRTRHNIGFLVLDALAQAYNATWQAKDEMLATTITIDERPIFLVKPQTFMNSSGRVIGWLQRKGIKPEEILVVHDELEKPFGTTAITFGGSARGHNGLRSIIEHMGKDFYRLRCGIGRPERKEDVGTWVLTNFDEPAEQLQAMIDDAVKLIVDRIQNPGM
jgi:PTH1 family peptidyl-tRNA hydrolase